MAIFDGAQILPRILCGFYVELFRSIRTRDRTLSLAAHTWRAKLKTKKFSPQRTQSAQSQEFKKPRVLCGVTNSSETDPHAERQLLRVQALPAVQQRSDEILRENFLVAVPNVE